MSSKTWLTCLALTLSLALAGGLERTPGALRAAPCPEFVVATRCGSVSVPLDHAQPLGRRIEVFVTVKEAFFTPKRPDPVFYLAGGPGTSSAPLVHPVSLHFALDRDVVGIDYRGAGHSRPALDCPGTTAPALAACRQRQTAQGTDWRFFNTTQAAQDVEAVRRALGYGQVNLYGTGYGTLWAQEVMRRFPGSLRSAVLTGVLPAQLNPAEELVPGLESLTRRLMRACAEDERCNTASPQLLTRFEEGFTRLPPRTQAELVARVGTAGADATHLSALLGAFQAALTGQALPPPEPALPSALPGAGPLQAAVNCQEQSPFTTLERVQAAHRRAPLFGGASNPAPAFNLCRALNLPPVNAAFHQPVRAGVPALLLTGEFDSRTPADWLERFDPLPSGWQKAVIRGRGAQAEWYPCGTGLLRAFLYRPAVRLDLSCAEQGRVLLR